MMKTINLHNTVYDLVRTAPELKGILHDLDFTELTAPGMLETAGQRMTILKGARLKGIEVPVIVQTLRDNGFEVSGLTDADSQPEPMDSCPDQKTADAASFQKIPRIELLKGYLTRLKTGDDLSEIRNEFVREFQDVDASEIMHAEQELMAQGTPLQEVQRLCDLHSALFHGATRAEKLARAEEAVQQSLADRNQGLETAASGSSRKEQAARLMHTEGHPLQTFTRENEALTEKILEAGMHPGPSRLAELRDTAVHYAKKGDLLYPLLKVKYGISGPSDVMWTVDDEIRDTLAALDQVLVQDRNAHWETQVEAVLQRMKEMIYKEQNILFPITAQHFTESEWQQIYRDSRQYPVIFQVTPATWKEAEADRPSDVSVLSEGVVRMHGGTLSVQELTAMLDTLPLELTFVDAADINRYFNEGPEMKAFKRPLASLGRKVYSCHPPKVEPMVRHIIREFRNGTRDEVAVWAEKGGRPMYVRYLAVRSKSGEYLGTLEAVQDMTFAKEHFLRNTQS